MEQILGFMTGHPILIGMFVVLLGLFVRNEMVRGGRSVSAQELVNRVNNTGAVVVDVRDKAEFDAGHIVDAINIPHASLADRVGELERYKDKPLVVACKMGQHSAVAGTTLRKSGFADVSRLSGGMAEWRNQNLPVVKGGKSSKAAAQRAAGKSQKGKSQKRR